MNLVQLQFENKSRAVGIINENKIINLTAKDIRLNTTYKVLEKVINESLDLEGFLQEQIKDSTEFNFNYDELLETPSNFGVKILPPLDHPDPYRLFISGTGLTHTGSVKSRDMMHNENDEKKDETDSAKMFQMGLKGGKPTEGKIGVAPEWFYKGNGFNLKGHKENLLLPDFSLVATIIFITGITENN